MSAFALMSRITNLVPNGDFRVGKIGQLPDGWELESPYDFLVPKFKLVQKGAEKLLLAAGGGNEDCLGWLSTGFTLTAGKTYRLRARFQISREIDPNANLLFAFYQEDKSNNGIFEFTRLDDGWIEGDNTFSVPGEGVVQGEVRIYFRLSASGKAWIREISMEECEPIPARPVRIVTTSGTGDIKKWAEVLDAASGMGADLALLPEAFTGMKPEAPDGPCFSLMREKAKEHGIYTAGTFLCMNPQANRVYNTGLVFDRSGDVAGEYRKNHPFSPEMFEGVTPGTEVPVFEAEFGTIGMMICYDSWFTDIAELLALKGAEIILFPSVGYYRSLMPARSADNCVRVVSASQVINCGIWDTSGAEVTKPNADSSRYANCDTTFRDVEKAKVRGVKLLAATLDLSQSPSPHNWGGPMQSAPGGRRNRRDQKRLLVDDIRSEICRWWK